MWALRLAAFSACLWSTTTSAQTLTEAQREEARGVFEAGRAAFADGRYEAALEYFERSYELTHAPELLYNIAQSADRMRRDERALSAFEAYLAELPDAPERPEVEARIRALRAALEARSAEAQAREAEAREAEAREDAPVIEPGSEAPIAREPSPAGWVVAGAGGLTAIVGAVLLGVASARAGEVDGAAEGTPWVDLRGAYADAETLGPAGGVLLGVGLATAAVGAVWGVVELGSARADVAIGPGSIELRGRF